MSYEEEVSGEGFFAELAEHQSHANRRILLMFSDMERITYSSIRHLLEKYNIDVSDEVELKSQGVAEARNVRGREWDSIVASMIEEYPAYIEEFYSVRQLAPSADRSTIDILIEHEQAMLDFAILHSQGASDSTAPLIQFIARHRRS